MRLPLYESPPDSVTYGGKKYALNLAFGRVLRYMDLCAEPRGLSRADVAEVALNWFIPTLKTIPAEDTAELLKTILQTYINPPERKLINKQPSPNVIDFNFDSGYIYASFMQAYGIDLYDVSDTMPWCKFIMLMSGLPDDCAIKQVMSIRAREMPIPNKDNQKEIQRLTELKLLYALPQAENENNSADGWNKLFSIMMKKAGESNG